MRLTLNITFVGRWEYQQYQPDMGRCRGEIVLGFDVNIAGLEER